MNCVESNPFLKQFKILRLSLEATQSIFYFDLANFVLAGRFHAVLLSNWRHRFREFPRYSWEWLKFEADVKQGLLYTWTDSLGTFFATFVIIKISVNDTNTICRSSKSITFPKIWRVWLKNWVCHAHFNFELLKGVAVLFSELCPSNFGQW